MIIIVLILDPIRSRKLEQLQQLLQDVQGALEQTRTVTVNAGPLRVVFSTIYKPPPRVPP